jgi:GNAT superfamily N-acetyltransferase
MQLLVHIGTDIVVRTPSRPDFHDGNVVDLIAPPAVESIDEVLERIRRTMEPVGVSHLHLRFELPLGTVPDPTLAAALVARGCRIDRLRVMELRTPLAPFSAPIGLERLTAPLVEPGTRPPGHVGSGAAGDAVDTELPSPAVVRERRWYAAAVLDRYAHGADVEEWRRWDPEGAAWYRSLVRELGVLDRAEVWLATRMGMPVATATVVRDLDGLAVVQDVVTHPANRRRGIARALVSAAIAFEQDTRPEQRILLAVTPASPAADLYLALGFEPLVDVVDVQRPAGRVAVEPEARPQES